MTLIREITSKAWLDEVQMGDVEGHYIVNKYGSADVGTAITPITTNLTYQTPKAATGLTLSSTSAEDYHGSSTGGWTVEIQGLDENWNKQVEEIQLSGTTEMPSANLWYRIYRMKLIESGIYADMANPFSHKGELNLTDAASNNWGLIDTFGTDLGVGQSKIGLYTVASGETAQLMSYEFSISSTKTSDLYLFVRDRPDITTPPYGTKRIKIEKKALGDAIIVGADAPLLKIEGPADIAFLVKAAASSSVSIDFQLLIHEHQ